jgi:hypothetical protein
MMKLQTKSKSNKYESDIEQGDLSEVYKTIGN